VVAVAIGKVKWFNNAKGYGFILPDEGGEDLFAHYSSIEMDGYKTLKAGQEVLFDVLEGPKGLHATNIRSGDADAQATAATDDQDTADVAASGEGVGEEAGEEVVAETGAEEAIGAQAVAAEAATVEAEAEESPGTSEVVSVTVSDAEDAESDTVEPSAAQRSN
jgi:CspA family cold shock protein